MKISVSVPPEDVEILDAYVRTHGVDSRSAAIHRAIALLETSQLSDAYAEAWQEWDDRGESEVWESTVADGLTF